MYIKHNFTSETELKKTLDYLYSQSKLGKCFHNIIEAAFNEVTIITAIHNIKSNQGAMTAGIDGATINKYLQMNRNELIQLVHEEIRHYLPRPVRREYIKKSNGKLRPLGIPTILDRIIQECLRIILEPIVEAKFYPHSYGFRPYRATIHAIKEIITHINRRQKTKPVIIIEGDIKGCYDNFNHRILLKKLWKIGIHDKRALAIIKEMLKAGYIERDLFHNTEVGTVQGGIISPLLANVYLNDFDWLIGRMYHHPKNSSANITVDRTKLRKRGVKMKYLIRYADDWIIMTTSMEEATRLMKYLNKYFKHRLKLELSSEKTVITNLTVKPAKFLGYMIKAERPRKTPQNPKPQNIVGKHYPDMNKVKTKVRSITQQIRKLRRMEAQRDQALQIEKVNAMITGLAEYHKSAICSKTFRYIDNKIYRSSRATFKAMYGNQYMDYKMPLKILSNRPARHKGYETETFAINYEDKYIGITKAFLTHSQRIMHNFNQNITPYTEQGRELYLKQFTKGRRLPLDRPPLYDIEMSTADKDRTCNNFEYYMNREYAYNRDKGKCKICGEWLTGNKRHCHRVREILPRDKLNKVSNLAWLCITCDGYVHGNRIPNGKSKKVIGKIQKYQAKLTS